MVKLVQIRVQWQALLLQLVLMESLVIFSRNDYKHQDRERCPPKRSTQNYQQNSELLGF